MHFSGRARIDKKTKEVCRRIGSRDSVIDHQDIDEVALSHWKCRVKESSTCQSL